MSENTHAMTVANDQTLTRMIGEANRRLVLVTPGLSVPLATAVAEKWRELGADAVSVTLDVDPEVCRLGFGQVEAIGVLQNMAKHVGTTLNTFSGLRIGILIADDRTLIYAPTPLLIEAAPREPESAPVKPNAIVVGPPPTELARDLGLGPEGAKEQIIGLDPVEPARLAAVEQELKALPPQPFDLSRRLRVYTAHIEFAELRLVGCMLKRRTIEIPSDLVGLADEQTRKLLESKFRVIDEADAGVWGEELRRIKDFIVERFLVHLPTYGHVVRMRDKEKFELAVRTLRRMVHRARDRKSKSLQAAIDRRLAALHAALLPGVSKNPPDRWKQALLRRKPSDLLRQELIDLTGTATEMLRDAAVELRFKGVTYDTLNDPKFIETVTKAMPDMMALHSEAIAAPVAATPRPTSN